ncbi:MAG TPA: insulinase family protein [Fimbriimonas sp.]
MPLLSLIACAAVLQAPIDQPPRLRTILENGAVVLVEKAPGDTATLSLSISADTFPEVPVHNGVRHLLEHLMARGASGDLDLRLETAGGFLRASTYRDAIQFEVTIPKSRLDLGFQAIRETLSLGQVAQEQIAHEAGVLRHEDRLRSIPAKVSAAAWDKAYEGQAPDPFGNLDVIAATTPKTLIDAHRKMMRGGGVALVAVGDLDLDETTRKAREILAALPSGNPERVRRGEAKAGSATVELDSSAAAVSVPGFDLPSTAASLMAGLALASEMEGAWFIYTPAAGPSLMVLGGEGMQKVKVEGLYRPGRLLARRWIQTQLQTPRGIASFRGLLLCQNPALRPETMLEQIDRVSAAQFEEAVTRYRGEQAIRVVGR